MALKIGVWAKDLAYRSRLMAWAKNADPLKYKWAEDIPRDEMVLLNVLWDKGFLWEFWKSFPLYARPDLLEWAWKKKQEQRRAGDEGATPAQAAADEAAEEAAE